MPDYTHMTNPFTDPQKTAILHRVCTLIVESVRAGGPQGTPGGTLYAVLMTWGASLEQYEQIMAGLVGAGKLRKSGELYFIPEGK